MERSEIDGSWHFPAQRPGCYYQRLTDCCWVCLGRIAAARVRQVGRKCSPFHEHSESEFSSSAEREGNTDADTEDLR